MTGAEYLMANRCLRAVLSSMDSKHYKIGMPLEDVLARIDDHCMANCCKDCWCKFLWGDMDDL